VFEAMIEYGMKKVRLTSSEIEVWREKTRNVWDKLSGKA
jgi:hypothetical protein